MMILCFVRVLEVGFLYIERFSSFSFTFCSSPSYDTLIQQSARHT